RRIVRDPGTVIVNETNVPVGSWNAGTDTWEYNGSLILGSFGLDPEVIYYVEGNAKIDTLLLAANAYATIVTRGWLAIENLGLLTAGGLCATLDVMTGPASAGASVCAAAGADTVQHLHLKAEEDLVIGYETIDVALNAALENAYLGAGVTAGTGIGTTIANVAGRSELHAYSEKGRLWALVSAVNALSDTRVNLCSLQDATLAFAASVANDVSTYDPAPE
ncbi:MAG: hypothetical protein ACREQ9_00425, partial [Candidatus Binatia bacterium]